MHCKGRASKLAVQESFNNQVGEMEDRAQQGRGTWREGWIGSVNDWPEQQMIRSTCVEPQLDAPRSFAAEASCSWNLRLHVF
jgi:hypothetical protein